jgi:hypothetical protein
VHINKEKMEAITGAKGQGTPRQQQYVDAVIETQSFRKAGAQFGVSTQTIHQAIHNLLKRLQEKGYSPQHDVVNAPLPDFQYKRISTLRNKEGEVAMQWQIQEADQGSRWTAMREYMDKSCAEVIRLPRIKKNDVQFKKLSKQLLTQYTITDYHLGMLAWHEEGGADWDLAIAKDTLRKSFKYMIANSPDAETGVFANIGDFLHYDGWVPATPLSGHILDTDSRFPKIVDAAVDIILEVVGMLLQKHEKVVIINMQGNHDMASSYWLQKICHTVYEQTSDRIVFPDAEFVSVAKTPIPYYALKHGDTMLCYHHGHKKNLKSQGRVYPAQFPDMWGKTKYRYGHTGHYHHTEVVEDFGIRIEMHNTLAAKDAYASHGGYFAERSANAITYHKKHGEFSRQYVKPGMFEDL